MCVCKKKNERKSFGEQRKIAEEIQDKKKVAFTLDFVAPSNTLIKERRNFAFVGKQGCLYRALRKEYSGTHCLSGT